MFEITIPALYLLAGIMAYAVFHHFSTALHLNRDPVQLLFGFMCLLAIPFVIFHAQMLQATDLSVFATALKRSIASILLFFILFPWFVALYTGVRPKRFLSALSTLFAILFIANQILPFSLQYEQLEGIRALTLPWGETITRGVGRSGVWLYPVIAGIVILFGYALFAMICKYRASRQRTDMGMLLAVVLFLMFSSFGILVRLSIINFVEPGPLGILAMIIVMSTSLTNETQRRLRTSERQFRSLFDHSPTGLIAIEPGTLRIVLVNNATLAMTGFSEAEFLEKKSTDLLCPDDLYMEQSLNGYEQLYQGMIDFFSSEKRYLKKDGGTFIGYTSVSALKDDKGKVTCLIASTVDITMRKQAESDIRESETRLRTIIEQSPIGLASARDGMTVDVNPVYLQIFGYKHVDEVRGQPLTDQIAPQCRAEVEDRARRRTQGEPGESSYETIGLRKDGSQFPVYISATQVMLKDGPLTFGFLIDISERKKAEAELIRIAHFDTLTNVPNRALLVDRMNQAIAQTSREHNMMAVGYLDLDGFKPINDAMGHEAGDQILIEVARRIGQTIRGGDTVARLGGDEFVVLLLGLEMAEECIATVKCLLEAISVPINLKNQSVTISASIGISIYPHDNEDPDTLLRHADQAMYIAKQSGRNRFHIYDPALDRRARDHNELMKSIRHGLKQDQFELFYQPKINLRTKELVGAEALIRWRHPERGLLSPAEFLRFIENTNLDIELGEWVTATALAQINHWENAGLDIAVSINISGYHLESPRFIEHLQQQLAHYPDMPKGKLQIEVLETVALNDIAIVRGIIEASRKLGVGFALDDFGTGYSSLSYLSCLPVDVLKIDQSFVRDMLEDKGDRAIVQSIIALARAFDRQTVAEGIETEDHYKMLVEMGCGFGQGYGIARPMPTVEMTDWKAASMKFISNP